MAIFLTWPTFPLRVSKVPASSKANITTLSSRLDSGHGSPFSLHLNRIYDLEQWCLLYWNQGEEEEEEGQEEEEEEKTEEGGRDTLLRWYNGGDGLKVTISCLPPLKTSIVKHNWAGQQRKSIVRKIGKINFTELTVHSGVSSQGNRTSTSVFSAC